MAKHRKPARWRVLCAGLRRRAAQASAEEFRYQKLIKLVDSDTREIHLFTPVATSGRRRVYVALCGKSVAPAVLVEPGGRHCARCLEFVPSWPGR